MKVDVPESWDIISPPVRTSPASEVNPPPPIDVIPPAKVEVAPSPKIVVVAVVEPTPIA